MANRFNKAEIGGEGVGKDNSLIVGNGFAKGHADLNVVIIRESDTIRDLVEKLYHNNVDAIYISSFDDIVKYLKENMKSNDLLITAGAGPIYRVGEMLLEEE